jgi:general secretion pathway protein F
MATFRYKAVTAAGTLTTGMVDAGSQADAIEQIRNLGHLPLTASQAGTDRWRALLPTLAAQRPSAATIGFATQELAALLAARLPLDRALAILAELDETRRLRKTLLAVLESVRGGMGLAEALDATGTFSKSYVTMVRAGEHGGNLEAALKRLAEYLARASAVRDAVISAMIYPIVLLCTTGVSIVFILMFVLPQFAPLFEQSGKPLPLPTAVALAIGVFLSNYWWILAILAAAAILGLSRAMRSPGFREARDRVVLRLPLAGDLVRKTEIERFTRMLGTLLSNGVALPQAIALSGDTLGNSVIARAVTETAARLREGELLSARLRQTGVFPPLSLDLIRVGEETGTLEEMLLKQADLYQHEVKHSVDRLLALLVPLMTVVMGLVVAGLMASILLAILSVNELAV